MSTALLLQGEDLNAMLAGDATWWPGLLARVRVGGSPSRMMWDEYRVKYALFLGWVAGDPAREKEYRAALADNVEARRELVVDGVYDIATAQIDAAAIRPSDKLKAAEQYLGGGGKGGGLTIGVGSGTGRVSIEVEFVPSEQGRVIEHDAA